jgi:hypothetical protein
MLPMPPGFPFLRTRCRRATSCLTPLPIILGDRRRPTATPRPRGLNAADASELPVLQDPMLSSNLLFDPVANYLGQQGAANGNTSAARPPCCRFRQAPSSSTQLPNSLGKRGRPTATPWPRGLNVADAAGLPVLGLSLSPLLRARWQTGRLSAAAVDPAADPYWSNNSAARSCRCRFRLRADIPATRLTSDTASASAAAPPNISVASAEFRLP